MTTKLSTQEQLAIQVAKDILAVSGAQAEIDKNCQAIRKARKGKPLGTVKSGDAVMIRFTEALAKAGKSEQTVKNYATSFRKAINDGTAFSMNAYRAKASKGSQAGKGKPESKGLRFEAKGEAKPEDIVKKLRELFNKLKAKDETAELASFLLDGLDEYEGK